MFNYTVLAKAFQTAACTLAIALSIMSMGVNSTWAETPLNYLHHSNPLATPVPFRLVQACLPDTTLCFAPGMRAPLTCCRACRNVKKGQPGYLYCG